MPIFKPKQKPFWQWSRVVHFLLALTATAYGGHLYGYSGSVWTGIAVIGTGLAWELSNRFLGKGYHPFADALDFWAFVAGALFGGVGWLVAG